MSDIPINPFLLAAQDNVFRGLVLDFLQNYAPAALTATLREGLRNLVNGYFGTSQDINMQGLVVTLDARYNIAGMIDEGVLATIRTNVANHAANTAAATPAPARPPTFSSRPAPSSFTTTTNPPSSQPPAPIKCHPPKLDCRITMKWRKSDWAYKCDACGTISHDRGDLNRHMKLGQPQRVGFRVISAIPEQDRHWYGVDNGGNEYMGDVVRTTRGAVGGKRQRVIPPPCGPRINAAERPKRERWQMARKEKSAEKKEQEEDGED